MKYHIVAVGQLKRGFLADGCHHYEKRLRPYAKLELTELKEGRGATAEATRERESQGLRSAATGHVVVLDERGLSHTTAALAQQVSALELRGVAQVSLLVGGAEGHADWLRSEADELWSLSALTLPHELARLVLLEQLYRIETLRAGHPYHRG